MWQMRKKKHCIVKSKSVKINHNHRDITICTQTSRHVQLPALLSKTMHVSVQIPKRNLSPQTPACYGEINIQSSHKGWTSKAANRISCCFIPLSLNQCHHMLLLAQDSPRWLPGRLALSKWVRII